MHNWKCGYCFCGVFGRGDHFRFGSVFIKKSNQTKIFFKKNRNRTETGSNWPVLVRFFRGKTSSNRFGSVFPVLARFFFVLVRFGSVWFFRFSAYKTETEPKPGQTDRFRFGFLGKKPVQTGLARFFRFWLGFFLFWFGSVRFGFFGFLLIKPKPNRTGWFF